ncbi:IS5 family transposase [Streptomyces sp. NPDC041068]|uniref:IS5 family transposase n=1 Tax=Streptomyces sp. NPDC041068 TaxID=3155130 RepID=UPI00340D62FE
MNTPDLPVYRYRTNTSDLEWTLIQPHLPPPAWTTPRGGRPEKWPRRRVVDAIRYVVDNGNKWRDLPGDFGIPWRTIFGYFQRWARGNVLQNILDVLRRRLRLGRGQCARPVRVIIDSQSVKGSETVPKATRGFDPGKNLDGRKRHLVVDREGLLVDLMVTPADIHDGAAARTILARLHAEHPEIVLVWGDSHYAGQLIDWARETLHMTVKPVLRPDDAKGLVLLPKRWIIERSNSWTMRARRNARDYERTITHAEAHLRWTFITLMTRRLARQAAKPAS